MIQRSFETSFQQDSIVVIISPIYTGIIDVLIRSPKDDAKLTPGSNDLTGEHQHSQVVPDSFVQDDFNSCTDYFHRIRPIRCFINKTFLHPHVLLNHWLAVGLEVASLHVLFRSVKDPCMCHKYLSYQSCQCLLNQA